MDITISIPLPGDIVDVTPAKTTSTVDIVVNMDGGVGGSWREVSLPENNQELKIHPQFSRLMNFTHCNYR